MMRGRWRRAAAATLALGVACALLPVLEDTRGQQALPSVVAANALRPVTAFAATAMIALARSHCSRRPAR
jgi:hypothetical protein